MCFLKVTSLCRTNKEGREQGGIVCLCQSRCHSLAPRRCLNELVPHLQPTHTQTVERRVCSLYVCSQSIVTTLDYRRGREQQQVQDTPPLPPLIPALHIAFSPPFIDSPQHGRELFTAASLVSQIAHSAFYSPPFSHELAL